MKPWIAIAALVVASPALAIPPLPPRPAEAAVAEEFVRATEQNDLEAYSALFAVDAKITNEAGLLLESERWLEAVSAEFTGYRQTHFLNTYAGYAPVYGQAIRRFMFLTETRNCAPNAAECFPRWRSQIITVADGKIIELQTTSSFGSRLTEEGAWTFYD